MAKNPLADIADFYKESVKKEDEKGFAETYKKATELLFDRLKEETKLDLHFEDVEYLDGYFIFGYGTNSVVHFHLKEAPGWLFGIWWSPVPTAETKDAEKKEYFTNRLDCDFFFQFEKEIDKFKPSASTFCSSFTMHFDESCCYGLYNACDDLKFAVEEPYLAFYRDMHCADFNHEYVSREKAKRYWVSHWKKKEKRKQIDLINAKAMYEVFKYITKPMVETGDAYIRDRGACISPRYEVVIKNPQFENGKFWVKKDGCYDLFEGYEDCEADKKLYEKTKKECAKREGYDFYFGNQFSDCCTIIGAKKFAAWLKEDFEHNGVLYGRKEDGTVFEGRICGETNKNGD